MRTIQTKLYTFGELSKEAQQHAIETNRDFNTRDDFWYGCVKEDRIQKLTAHGFHEPKIYFYGFWSQGDGACFVGSLDNDGLLQFLTATKKLRTYPKLTKALKSYDIYVNIKITHNDHYYHAYSTTIEDYTEMQDNSPLYDELQKEYDTWFSTFFERDARNARIGWYIDECEDIYRHFKKEYEYQTDDETIAESLIANGIEFTSDGEMY